MFKHFNRIPPSGSSPAKYQEKSGNILFSARGLPHHKKSHLATSGHSLHPSKQVPVDCLEDERLSLFDVVKTFLTEGFAPEDPRFFGPIFKPADGSSHWYGDKNYCYDLDNVISSLCKDDKIIGLRHRNKTRVLVVDFDNHRANQPKWKRDDTRIRALVSAVEAAGCGAVLVPTPRGLHLWIITPEARPIVAGHWCLVAILRRAGISADLVDLFPSIRAGEPHLGPKQRTASNGIRLPGQAGTVKKGDLFTDPLTIYQAFCFELKRTACFADSQQWQALQDEGARCEQQWKATRQPSPIPRTKCDLAKKLAEVSWSGQGQSNSNLGRLANIGYISGNQDPESLADFIIKNAQQSPGFNIWASPETKTQLAQRAKDWALSCIRRPPRSAGVQKESTDPGRNQRLHREALVKCLESSRRAAKEFGVAALNWSERAIAKWAGISRDTLRRLRFHWKARVSSALWPPRSAHPVGGTDPLLQGGGVSAVRFLENQSHSLVLSNSAHQLHQNHGPPPSNETDMSIGSPPRLDHDPLRPMSSAQNKGPSQSHTEPSLPIREKTPAPWENPLKISRERDELARWLGLLPA
jgi:hypothetical protein